MAKYDPLFEFLCRAGDDAVEMSFEQIEQLVGALPASARQRTSWWSNDLAGASNVQVSAWLRAGREVESVDRAAERVRFSRAAWRRGA
jgi:hypothetical protein